MATTIAASSEVRGAWNVRVGALRDRRDLVAAAVGLVIVAIILGGMTLGIRPLTLAGAAIAIVSAVISPPIGLFVIAFLGPLRQPDVLPAPGFNILLVGSTLLGCVYRLPVDRPRIRVPAPLVIVLAFTFYAFVQQLPEMLTGYTGEEPYRIGFQFFQLCGLVGTAIAAGYVMSGNRPWIFLAASLGALTVAGALTWATFETGPAGSPFAGLLAASEDGSRAVGPFGNPNYFGEFLATGIVTAAALATVAVGRTERGLLFLVALVGGAAVALSLSRGAIVATLAGLASLAVLRSRFLGAALVMAGVVIILFAYPAFVEFRLGPSSETAYSELNASDASRFDAVLAGPQLFLTSPLFGVGFGQYSALSARFTEGHISIGSHNWYMNVLAEQGLVGVVLWASFLISLVVCLRKRPEAPRIVGLAVLATFAAGSLFTTQPASFQTSVLPVIVISATLVANWGPGPGLSPRPPEDPIVPAPTGGT
jgi:hypothetical protein